MFSHAMVAANNPLADARWTRAAGDALHWLVCRSAHRATEPEGKNASAILADLRIDLPGNAGRRGASRGKAEVGEFVGEKHRRGAQHRHRKSYRPEWECPLRQQRRCG